jgi:hypothetical protein
VKLKSTLITLGVLLALTIGVLFAGNALASGITLHNNYGSDKIASVQLSSGAFRDVKPGATVTSGTWTRIFTPPGWCARYGWPGTGPTGHHCNIDGSSWVTRRSIWVDFYRAP